MFCEYCGSEILKSDKFCPKCGRENVEYAKDVKPEESAGNYGSNAAEPVEIHKAADEFAQPRRTAAVQEPEKMETYIVWAAFIAGGWMLFELGFLRRGLTDIGYMFKMYSLLFSMIPAVCLIGFGYVRYAKRTDSEKWEKLAIIGYLGSLILYYMRIGYVQMDSVGFWAWDTVHEIIFAFIIIGASGVILYQLWRDIPRGYEENKIICRAMWTICICIAIWYIGEFLGVWSPFPTRKTLWFFLQALTPIAPTIPFLLYFKEEMRRSVLS